MNKIPRYKTTAMFRKLLFYLKQIHAMIVIN